MKAVILALLLSLPPYFADTETPSERVDRLDVLATSITSATHRATCSGPWSKADWCRPFWPKTQRLQLAVLLVLVGNEESRFAEHIHEGRCGPKECDPMRVGGRLVHQARGPWQIHWSPLTAQYYNEMEGSGVLATSQAAYTAARVLAASRGRCRRLGGDWVVLTLSSYARGSCRVWRPAVGRAERFRRLMVQAVNYELQDDERVALVP